MRLILLVDRHSLGFFLLMAGLVGVLTWWGF